MADIHNGGNTDEATAGPGGPPTGGTGRGRLWLWIGGAALVVVLLGATAWVLTRSDDSGADEAAAGSDASLNSELAEQFSLTPGESLCVVDRSEGRLSHDTIRALAADPDPDDAGQVVLDEILAGCSLHGGGTDSGGTDEASGSQDGEPYSHGDDAELDALWDRCSKEGTAVCDELFNEAPEGSEYEAFGDTCGGRGDPQVACAPDALAESGPDPADGDGDPSGGDGGTGELDRLKDECASGDVQACLALEFQAPEGSDYAEFGRSCGGRPDDDRCKEAG